jgi:hypothetical protein
MQFLMLFSFFANNSRMKQPTPVFLSYMDFPYAIEGGSTKKFLGVLNKLCTAKREAILRQASPVTVFFSTVDTKQNAGSLLTLVSDTVFYGLSHGSLGFALHGSSFNHFFQRI